MTLELPWDFPGGPVKRVANPDELARLAERDPNAATFALLEEQSATADRVPIDWPDQLALDILSDPTFSIQAWAQEHRLHPGTIARGFRLHFGVTAAEFRASARAHRALRAIFETMQPFAQIAAAAGFADQAHMSRAISAVAAMTPSALRRASPPREGRVREDG